MGTDRHLTYSACWFVNYWQIAVCLRIRIWNSFLKTLLDLFPVHGLLNVCMTWRCLSPEQRDITISGSRFSVGILKALFRYILQYLQPPQTVLRANMFAGIFVKSKHDRVVGESVQSLTKLIKIQQLMNSCGKCLMAFPQWWMLIRKAYKAKTILLPRFSCTPELKDASMALFVIFIHYSAGCRSSFYIFFGVYQMDRGPETHFRWASWCLQALHCLWQKNLTPKNKTKYPPQTWIYM